MNDYFEMMCRCCDEPLLVAKAHKGDDIECPKCRQVIPATKSDLFGFAWKLAGVKTKVSRWLLYPSFQYPGLRPIHAKARK